ncbi:MAG: hypothetical protein U1F66_12240 [bacterium]
MAHYLKIHSLAQQVACPHCRRSAPLKEFPHGMNFGMGVVRFTCPDCHREIGRLSFQRWNALHRG